VDYPWDSPIATEIRERFRDTYCEKSPRGKLRIFCYGKPRRCGKGTVDKAVEVYDHTSPRYLSVTGTWIEDAGREVTEQQAALDWLYEAYFKPRPQAEAKKPKSSGTVSQPDQDIIEKATAARNGAKFATLFYGGWQGAEYPSQSEADAALCSMLAFWTQDEGQIDRIFRQSALMRPKWDKRHHADGRTYGEATIERALGSVTQTYQGTAQHGREPSKEKREEGTEGKESGPSGPANARNGAGDVKESPQEVVEGLAKLPLDEYESVRVEKAKKLKWRASFLDEEVRRARAKAWADVIKQNWDKGEVKPDIECPTLKGDDPIVLIKESFAGLGYGGDIKLPLLLYLCYTSRLIAHFQGMLLSHAQVVGAPASGKNFAVDTALALFPPESL